MNRPRLHDEGEGLLVDSRIPEEVRAGLVAFGHAIEVKEKRLSVDGRDYGPVAKGDVVYVDRGKVTVNGRELARLPVRGVIVTALSESGTYNFVSRFFAPAAGVPEDPVTGSAHCGLAPFWAERLNRTELVGYQASERGGIVRVRLEGSRVHLGGQAVTVLRGELLH